MCVKMRRVSIYWRLTVIYRGSSAFLVREVTMPSFFSSRFYVQSIPSPLVGWTMNDPVFFCLGGFSLHGERAKELLAGPAEYRGTRARTPCPRFRDARAKASAGVGQAWQANLSGSFSPTGWGGGCRRLIERASLPCSTIGKYFLSFFHLCFVHPQPQSPTPAQLSLPSTLNLHQKKRSVSFLVAILHFYILLCIVEYLSLIRSRCSPRACPEL